MTEKLLASDQKKGKEIISSILCLIVMTSGKPLSSVLQCKNTFYSYSIDLPGDQSPPQAFYQLPPPGVPGRREEASLFSSWWSFFSLRPEALWRRRCGAGEQTRRLCHCIDRLTVLPLYWLHAGYPAFYHLFTPFQPGVNILAFGWGNWGTEKPCRSLSFQVRPLASLKHVSTNIQLPACLSKPLSAAAGSGWFQSWGGLWYSWSEEVCPEISLRLRGR